MNEALRNRLLAAAAGLAVTAAGGYVATQEAKPSAAVTLAREIGLHYESSGRHIGTPYVDRLGRGQPLTVCSWRDRCRGSGRAPLHARGLRAPGAPQIPRG